MKKVLVVDDDMFNLKMTELALKKQYEVVKASSGEKAVEYFRTGESADLILMDVLMPGMDGFETYSAITEFEGVSRIPVFFLTAETENETRQRVDELGAGLIIKPFKTADLFEAVSLILE